MQTGKTTPVEEMSFATDSAAYYTFYAIYDDIKSNEINIEAIDIELLISADKQTVKANNKDTVIFAVRADGEDVTSFATIIFKESPDSTLTESEFHTKSPGAYTFYAMYNGRTSNEIRVDASAVIVTLSVDKTSIRANNSDKAAFIVKADDENVTSSAVIMMKKNWDDEALDAPEFLTDEAASYTFYAIYDDDTTNEVIIEATYVELRFLRNYTIIELSSNTCPNCPLMAEELVKIQRTLPGQLHVITLHPYGRFCYSELAGALAETANNFAENANTLTPPPPMAIVDLYEPVNLYPTTTGRRLADAINRSTLRRDRVSLTGIAVQSKVDDDNVINFEVSVKTKKTDTYRFFAFVVEDGVVHRQILSDRTVDQNYVHNNLATYQLAGVDPYMGASLGTIGTAREVTRLFSICTNDFNTGRDVNLANCRIVCYTLRADDGVNYFVDNVATCPVNGSVRYIYEK